MLVFSGCIKPEVSLTIKPFEDIPIESTKRIEFHNFTVTSREKELGRSKMVTNTQDMQDIAKYLKTISCTVSNQKDKRLYFTISLIDNTEKERVIYIQ